MKFCGSLSVPAIDPLVFGLILATFDVVAAQPLRGAEVRSKAAPVAPAMSARAALPKHKQPPIDKLAILSQFRKSMPMHRFGATHAIDFDSADLDSLLIRELGSRAPDVAPIASDERFIRRLFLDTTGRLPGPARIVEFTSDDDPRKRAKLVDELLATPEFAHNWARYWRSVILYNTEASPRKISPQALEDWLAEQFQKDAGWDEITAQLVAADGKDQEHGPDNFILAQEDKPERLAAETARIFMGINIQCAECHHHPFDRWKREQFHELAAFFAPKTYYMPNLQHPEEKTEIQPRFLLGEKPRGKLRSDEKRVAVAAYLIYNPENYWFARAFVNRVWHELLGDAFYAVDSLGPDNEVQFKTVVNRLAAVFRYRDFKPRWLFRTLLNSQAYQREIRNPNNETDRFTAVRPMRLRGDQVAEVLGQVLPEAKADAELRKTFSYDPSLPQNDIDGSIQQALLLMNDSRIQKAIAGGTLAKRLAAIRSPDEFAAQLYLSVLARNPSDEERDRARQHLKQSGNRRQAVEDLLWSLINSAEFKTKR